MDYHDSNLLLYGEKQMVKAVQKKLRLLDIEVNDTVVCDSDVEDGSIYELLYLDLSDRVCALTDTYSTKTIDYLKEMNVDLRQFQWMECYEQYYAFDDKKRCKNLPDPTIGYTQIDTEINNSAIIQYTWINKDSKEQVPVRILTLGGSTTTAHAVWEKTWSELLSEILLQGGVSHVILCAGMSGYNASQEMLVLIRDGVVFKPDIVVNFSGFNNACHAPQTVPKHPFLHMYQ